MAFEGPHQGESQNQPTLPSLALTVAVKDVANFFHALPPENETPASLPEAYGSYGGDMAIKRIPEALIAAVDFAQYEKLGQSIKSVRQQISIVAEWVHGFMQRIPYLYVFPATTEMLAFHNCTGSVAGGAWSMLVHVIARDKFKSKSVLGGTSREILHDT